MPETRKYTVVDLFAGVGGLSYGFSRNDRFEIILANEMQKDIAKAYAQRRKQHTHTEYIRKTGGGDNLWLMHSEDNL